MKIALVGYGKMGHIIRSVAERAGHNVVLTVDTMAKDADVIIEGSDAAQAASAVVSAGVDGMRAAEAVLKDEDLFY
jgi:4-hydroxy-tetrahydrodipicolinate reductase